MLSVCCTLCVRQVNKNYPANADRKIILLSLEEKREADGLVPSGQGSLLVSEAESTFSSQLHASYIKHPGEEVILLGTIFSGCVMFLCGKTQCVHCISAGGAQEGVPRTAHMLVRVSSN